MSDPNKINKTDFNMEKREGAAVACAAWATLLPEAAEGLLSEAEQKALDGHVLTCPGCAWELADAQRGAAWMALLKGHAPEPPATLLSSILKKTSGVDLLERAVPVVSGFPAMPNGVMMPSVPQIQAGGLWSWLEHLLGVEDGFASALQPRLAMTSAMAFFSICLTLNLLGVSVRDLHAESLRPAGLQRTVADIRASLVRSFEGIRMVYRVESRVNEWRTASAAQTDSPLGISR